MKKINAYPLEFKQIIKKPIWGSEQWLVSAIDDNESIVINGKYTGFSLPKLIEQFGEQIIGKCTIEKYGNKFPLLIKFIKSNADLSIQVHPNDELAKKRHNCFGKNEMWYVLAAKPEAKLISGFKTQINKDEYISQVQDGTFSNALNQSTVRKGDVFYIPAGRVHAICAGCFILEVQQSSDITYRIYDYNRTDNTGKTRQLHTELALDAIDFNITNNPKGNYIEKALCKDNSIKLTDKSQIKILASTGDFLVTTLKIKGSITIELGDSYAIIVCLKGKLIVSTKSKNNSYRELKKRTCLFMPCALKRFSIIGDGEIVVIK